MKGAAGAYFPLKGFFSSDHHPTKGIRLSQEHDWQAAEAAINSQAYLAGNVFWKKNAKSLGVLHDGRELVRSRSYVCSKKREVSRFFSYFKFA